MKLLTNVQQKPYENAKICYICKEKFDDKHAKDKKYCKLRDICNLRYSVHKEIPRVFFIMNLNMITI